MPSNSFFYVFFSYYLLLCKQLEFHCSTCFFLLFRFFHFPPLKITSLFLPRVINWIHSIFFLFFAFSIAFGYVTGCWNQPTATKDLPAKFSWKNKHPIAYRSPIQSQQMNHRHFQQNIHPREGKKLFETKSRYSFRHENYLIEITDNKYLNNHKIWFYIFILLSKLARVFEDFEHE